MVNYQEIVQLPKQDEAQEDLQMPVQNENGGEARKLGMKSVKDYIGSQFLPNTTTNKEHSTGVTDEASVAVSGSGNVNVADRGSLNLSGSASIELGGSASIELGSLAKLYAKGAGAISGLQGSIAENRTSLYANARVYKINQNSFQADTSSQEIANSFLENDLFYFIADPKLKGDACIWYANMEGASEQEIINQDSSLMLLLIERNNLQLRFKKISSSPDVSAIKNQLDEEIRLREAADKILQKNIDVMEEHLRHEINGRTSWNEGFRSNLDSEAGDRIAGDDALQGRIDSEIRDRIKADDALQVQIDDIGEILQPIGTDRQVLLGDGTPSPEPEQGEPDYNAPSSLFAIGTHGNAPDYILMEFNNQAGLIEWDSLVTLLANEFQNRGLAIIPPLAIINSAHLTITAPVNGRTLDAIVSADDNPANYEAGMVAWSPLDEIINGTKAYTAVFTIIPLDGFKFNEALSVLLNGVEPDEYIEQSDNSWRITKSFPKTMTANPKPEVTVAMSAGVTKPSTATKIDSGSYTSEIAWTGTDNVFNHENSEGTIKLTAASGYRWNTDIANVNGTDMIGTLSADGITLTLASVVIWNPTSLANPTLTIAAPVYGNDRPITLTGTDASKNKYTVAIEWLPNTMGNIFSSGINTGKFTLTAATGYVWDSSAVSLNGVNITPAALSADKTKITFNWDTPSITIPLAPPQVTVAVTAGAAKPLVLSGGEWVGTINWTGTSNVFNHETTTATIVLTANAEYRWNAKVVKVNGTEVTGTLSNNDQTLTLANAVTFTPSTITNPSIAIAEPAIGNARPSSANTQDSSNYTTAIAWAPSVSDGKFNAGNHDGTFTLTSKSGCIFGSNALKINNESLTGSRTSNNQILTAVKSFNIATPNEGTFTDTRDGKVYPWRLMPDGKKWMTVNLDYVCTQSIVPQAPPLISGGRLYSYDVISRNAQTKVTPNGWHLPSRDEWAALVRLSDADLYGLKITTGTYVLFSAEALKLKATWGWKANGTDDYGFCALPSGRYFDGSWSVNTENPRWWSSTSRNNSSIISLWTFDILDTTQIRFASDVNSYLPVRCIMD